MKKVIEEDKLRGVRGYARLDTTRFAALADKSFATISGKGVLGITIEPKRDGKRYQGIVELVPGGIAPSARIAEWF